MHSRGVYRTGLFGEDVLAGRDGCLDVHWSKVWRRCQQHHVHATVDHLPVGVEPEESPVHGHVHLGGDRLHHLEAAQALIDPVGEHVADGRQHHVALRGERL